MIVLGLDPATATGWAVLSRDGSRIASGVFTVASGSHPGHRFRRFRDWLAVTVSRFGPSLIAFERVWWHQGAAASQVYGALRGLILTQAAEANVECVPIDFSTVKKHATGHGKASKAAMQHATRQRWGVDVTHDEADALWIADCGRVRLLMPEVRT